MKKLIMVIVATLFGVPPGIIAGEAIHVTPYPNQVEIRDGFCDLSKGVVAVGSDIAAEQLYQYLRTDYDILRNSAGVPVTFVTTDEIENKEGYRLEIGSTGITIGGASDKGHFYAIQTLRQLIKDHKAPCLVITDSPAFTWRAFMLDEARHFHGKETVKRLMDEMARLKMNRFHWHLTDDTGWRIEIRKYPLLTQIGSRRDSTQIDDKELNLPGETGNPAYDAFLKRYQSNKYDSRPHAGFYTQDEIRELVAYAAERHIEIVPEISMPGHASAAIAAYPWLGTTKERITVPCKFGVLSQVYDPSSPQVMTFLQDVLREVSEVFPSPYIHIGGDEVKFGQWEQSASVQQYMKDNGLANCRDLQVKMTNDMCHFIEAELGKTMIGWSEILGINSHLWGRQTADATEKLSQKAIVQFWTGNKDILHYALKNGYRVVNSYCEDTYIDYSYDQVPLERAYGFDPVPAGYRKEHIYGLGCQLWTEWVRDRNDVEYHVFPRIAAYAETAWTDTDNKSYERFKACLNPMVARWINLGYNVPKEFNKL